MSDLGQLAVIIASVRKDRLGPTVATWFLNHVPPGTDVIDLATLHLPSDLAGGADTELFAKRIEHADAVVIVTPEYNRGYPGALKTAIDTLVAEWQAKPVGFVSYGGISGGLRAVEQLRLVLAELHAVTVQASVSLPHAWDLFDEQGELREPRRPDSAAAKMLGQLAWWSGVLREGRATAAFGQ